MDPIAMLRQEINHAHKWLEDVMADVTGEAAHYLPGGTAHPIGSRYAHVLVSEDMLVQGMLQGAPPIHAKGGIGLADPMGAFAVTQEWAQSVQVDLDAMRTYAQAVYAATDAYLAGLSAEDLENEVDLSSMGYGKWQLGNFLLSFLFGHMHNIMGEIAAVKGMQGYQGMPF